MKTLSRAVENFALFCLISVIVLLFLGLICGCSKKENVPELYPYLKLRPLALSERHIYTMTVHEYSMLTGADDRFLQLYGIKGTATIIATRDLSRQIERVRTSGV